MVFLQRKITKKFKSQDCIKMAKILLLIMGPYLRIRKGSCQMLEEMGESHCTHSLSKRPFFPVSLFWGKRVCDQSLALFCYHLWMISTHMWLYDRK